MPQSLRRVLASALPLVVFAATVWFLVFAARQVGWQEMRRLFRQADPLLLFAAFASNLLRYVLWSTRWWLLMRPIQRAPWHATFGALMASVFVNTVIPAARPLGGLVRARHLARRIGSRTGPLWGVAIVDQMGYGLVSVALGAAVVPLVLRGERPNWLRDLVLAVLAALTLLLFLRFLWRHRDLIQSWIERRVPGAMPAVGNTLGAVRTVVGNPRSWTIVLIGASLVWTANIATYKLAGAAVGADLGIVAVAVAFSVGSLAGSASGTPGGAGTTESAALLPLLALGVPTEIALATVLLARSAHYLSALLIGGGCAFAGWRREVRQERVETAVVSEET